MVSIPFKRESVSKVAAIAAIAAVLALLFQFPSNGKAYPKDSYRVSVKLKMKKVSIPFKRESVSKGYFDIICGVGERGRFNSLQTGKRIQRDPILSPVGPWLQNAKTKHEVHKAFFPSKFSPKTPQTHVCIDPNTIF